MNKVIGVLGCGWLGLPLAKKLVEQGFTVKGTTTSKDKMDSLTHLGIESYLVQISESEIEGNPAAFLEGIDFLIINIPPRLRGKGPKENYVRKIQLLLNEIASSSVNNILFVSSTSVYGENQGEVDEETIPIPSSEAGKQLLETEKLIRENSHVESTIIRFAGLIGPDRHPVNMLSGRTNLTGGNAPINLIHLDDCIGIITNIIQKNAWGILLNAVYSEHPTKESYYTEKAMEQGLEPPVYMENKSNNFKKITSCSPFITKYYRFLTSI